MVAGPGLAAGSFAVVLRWCLKESGAVGVQEPSHAW